MERRALPVDSEVRPAAPSFSFVGPYYLLPSLSTAVPFQDLTSCSTIPGQESHTFHTGKKGIKKSIDAYHSSEEEMNNPLLCFRRLFILQLL